MSIQVHDMIVELTENVPAVNGVPNSDQYKNAVTDAVRTFSEKCGLRKHATLSIEPGVATYNLPDDFLRMIELAPLFFHLPHYLPMMESAYFFTVSPFYMNEVLYDEHGLIPRPAHWHEQYDISDGQITFVPTPTFTLVRHFAYKAGWILTPTDDDYDDGEYARMDDREKGIVMLKAQANALRKQSNQTSAISYDLGAVKVDNGKVIDSLQVRITALEDQFKAACDDYNGAWISA